MSNEPLIPTHGGHRKLKGFQVAQLAYDVTVRFVDRYIDRFSRTRDQMVQAAFQNGSIACKPFCGEFSNAWKSKGAGSACFQGLEGFAVLDVEVGWRKNHEKQK